jgi:energy-coupling factor transport system ATP-binding protein
MKGFGYTYPGFQTPALKDVSLTILPREFVILAGPSGSGVSTLIQALNGIVPHSVGGRTTGEVWVAGRNVLEHKIQEMADIVGIVFQDPETQQVGLTPTEEVEFGPENFRLEPEEISRRSEEILRYVGLYDVREKFNYELSGGQQQKLAIGSVLVMNPQLLALDNPTANLDPVGTQDVKGILARMKEDGKTIILSDQALDEFLDLATRLIVLKDGTIFADGEPRSVLDEHGREMRDELGVWLPQLAELDLELQRRLRLPPGLPVTVEEALERYQTIQFQPSNEKNEFAVPEANTQPEQPPIVQIKGVSFAYPDGTSALQDVSFNVRRNVITAILGPNGSGKTTLSKLIVGLLQPTQGDILFAGKSVKGVRVSELTRRVGFVFQNPEHQFVRDTVREEIAYSLSVLGTAPAEIDSSVSRMLRLFDLEEMAERHPFTLSGGEKRRLSVATMLIGQPDLLVLDEPTYGQDRKSVQGIMDLVVQHVQNDVTVLMITHNMQIVQEYAEDVVLLEYGRVKYHGKVKDLWRDEQLTEHVSFALPLLPDLVKQLRRNGHAIHPETYRITDFVNQLEPIPSQP